MSVTNDDRLGVSRSSLVAEQLIRIGEELWSDVQYVTTGTICPSLLNISSRSTNVPHQRFNLFQLLQYYLKVVVFLLPKFHNELERDEILSRIVHQILNDGICTLSRSSPSLSTIPSFFREYGDTRTSIDVFVSLASAARE